MSLLLDSHSGGFCFFINWERRSGNLELKMDSHLIIHIRKNQKTFFTPLFLTLLYIINNNYNNYSTGFPVLFSCIGKTD